MTNPEAAAIFVPLDEIHPWENNPRNNTHSVPAVEASIKRFGFASPIVARKANGMIIAGHTRWAAAQKLGLDKVPVRFLDLDDTDAKLLAISDNSIGEIADWTPDDLAQQLAELRAAGVDLAITGWGEDRLDEILAAASDYTGSPFDSEAENGQSMEGLFSVDDQINAAFDYFRSIDFPYRRLPLHICMRQINALRAKPLEELKTSRLGTHVADTFHPHRFHATVKGKTSPFDAYQKDAVLLKSIRMGFENGGTVGKDWPGPLAIVSGTQACANFRSGFAAYLYRKHCPPKGTVLDTSTGYGGRLVGFFGSNVDGKYIGIDPNVPTYNGNVKMSEELGLAHMVELINLPAEDVDHDLVAGRCDFAFTSPPYFTKEHYSEDDTQSWKRYPKPDQWVEGFLEPMMRLQFAALKSGCFSIVNIADVKIGSKLYPCSEWTIEAGKKAGFEFLRTDGYKLVSSPAGAPGYEKDMVEPVHVFRKP